jgi:hypothetical protein
MSTTRNLFTRLKEKTEEGCFAISDCLISIKNSRSVAILLKMSLVAGIQVTDFVCNEMMKKDSIDWGYYSREPSRITWLVLSSMILGYNLQYVWDTLREDMDREEESKQENRTSALQIFSGLTTFYTLTYFANKALMVPINNDNGLYIGADTLLNGALTGSLLTSAGYFLKKLNYSIKPITSEHVKYFSAGILLTLLTESADAILQNKLNDRNEWDSLISPGRVLAWHLILAVIQGSLYGITALSAKQYSRREANDAQHEMWIKFRNGFLIGGTILGFVSKFAYESFNVPINASNAGYITLDSVAEGIPGGFVSGCTMFTLFKLTINNYRGVQSNSSLNESLLSTNEEDRVVFRVA